MFKTFNKSSIKMYDDWLTAQREAMYSLNRCVACGDFFEMGEDIEHTIHGDVHAECFNEFARQKLKAIKGVAE